MPAAIHILFYCAYVTVVALLLLYIWVSGKLRSYRRGVLLGLLFSPVGLVLPYLLFLGVGFLYYRTSPPYDFADVHPALRVPMLLLLFFGPLVGPPVALLCAVAWSARTPPA